MPLPKNIDAIVHIGAGQCEELATYLASSAKEIVLIEPNPRLAAELRLRCENEPRVSVLEVAVSNNPADRQLSEYNLADANSLYAPTGLKKLFPGLRFLRLQAVTTITADELLKQRGLSGDQNALVIQAPGAESGIIESLTESGGIDQFSYLSVTSAETPLYATPSEAAAVLKVLQEQGFDLVRRDSSDPDWPIWTLYKNALKHKFADLTVKYHKVSEQSKQVQKELARERTKNKDPASALFKVEQENENYKDSLNRARKELSEEQKKTKRLSAELAQLKKGLAAYKEGLNEESGQSNSSYTSSDFDILEKRLEYLFNQHTLQLEQAANALGRHVTSTVKGTAKEIEAGIALQQLFGRDLPSLEDQGNRLPAAVALQLSRQLRSTPYDVIIEFGSGVTTSFMAHTLRNQLKNGKSGKGTDVVHHVESSDDSLPKRIVCFEHNRANYDQLAKRLDESGLVPIVQLKYAPMVVSTYQGQEGLFYDCRSSLQRLATLLEGRQARIFVLANTSRADMVAALPKLLQYLPKHTLDVVVNVEGQDALVLCWHGLLDERGLEYQPAVDFGSTLVKRITVNP